MAESISFLFHAPMSIAYLLWLISFYHSSFYVNKDFLLSVIWFNAYLVPPTWVKKYYKWGWGSGVGGGERGERFYCNIPCGKNLKSQRRSQPQKKSFRNFRLILNFINICLSYIKSKYPKKCSIFETCMFTCDCLLIEKNFVNTPTVN